MHLLRVGVALIDDARHLVTVNVGGVGEQMRSIFIRFCFKTTANVVGAVGVKIVSIARVQPRVPQFMTDNHLFRRIA